MVFFLIFRGRSFKKNNSIHVDCTLLITGKQNIIKEREKIQKNDNIENNIFNNYQEGALSANIRRMESDGCIPHTNTKATKKNCHFDHVYCSLD